MLISITEIASPVGALTACVHDGALCALAFYDDWSARRTRLEKQFGQVELASTRDPAGVASRFVDYFAGDVHALDSIPVAPYGTPFQQRVWAALRKIPAGQTASYGELARAISAPSAVRAVGAANGSNPIAIVIPCHRVIGADGRLVGYGGGLDRKRWLLRHEGARFVDGPAVTAGRSAAVAQQGVLL